MHHQPNYNTTNNDLDHPTLELEQDQYHPTDDQHRHPIENTNKTLEPEHVITEEQHQIKNHPDHSNDDANQQHGELQLAMDRLHQRPTGENEQERQQKDKPNNQANHQCASYRDWETIYNTHLT